MRDFTKKIDHKEMTLFLLPLIGVKLFQQIAGIVNVVVINRMLGQEIITCISACRIYPMLQNNLLGVAATGFGVYVTRMIGKKDRKEQQAAVAKVLSGTCILTLAGFLMLFFIEPLLTLTNVPESIRAHAREYLFWLFAGSGALVFHNLFLSMLYGLGESAFAGGVSAAGVCLQPILTLLFVKHSGGMADAVAQAQLVNRLILAAVLFGYLWWKYRYLFAEGLKPSADAKEWRELWSCGFSASVMLMIVWCGTFLIQRQVNRMPEVHISAYMYAIMVEDLILVPIWGCGEAASYILAQNAGAGKFSQVRHYYRRLNRLGGIFCLILIGVVWLSAPSLVRLVVGPASENLYDSAIRWLHVMCFVFWGISASEIGRSSLRAVGAYRSMQLLGVLESVLRMVIGLSVIADSNFDTLIGSFFAIFVIMGTAFLLCNGMVLKKLAEEEKMEHKIITLAQEIIAREPGRRPEADWIQKRVKRFAEAEGIKSRAETDSLIFEKMYARAPKKTETTKIRYWRTGHHLPASREEGLRFAEVLRLDETERLYFLQAYMEKSDVVYEKVPEENENSREEYEKRTALMETMISEYIGAVPAHRMIQLDIPYESLAAHVRHLYCMDALKATALAKNLPEKNWGLIFGTNNYEAEFQRIRRLSGEIPRRMVLRQILLMGIPYLNRAIMDERLTGLGYLPLTEGHTSPKGALLDDLIIGFFQLYEETCMGKDPLACRNWALEQFQRLDTYFLDCKKEEYRILYFRILSTMLGYGESK